MRGKIVDLSQAYGKTLVSLLLDVPAADLESFVDKEVACEIKVYKERRSLSQNGYYWTLITQVAAHHDLMISTARLHNLLLRQHPRYWMINDSLVPVMIPDTEEAEIRALEDSTVHMIPTSHAEDEKRKYYLLRGSSTYDTAEMSVLLDDLIEKAKELGINTLTPDELERMRIYERQKSKEGSER